LVEGNSLRSTSRITKRSINTVSKLLVDIGAACSEFQNRTIRNLTSMRIECDEIWAFCYAKAKNVPEEHADEPGYGDIWTWTAIDPDTKLIPSWLVGWRGEMEAVDGEFGTAYRIRRVEIHLAPSRKLAATSALEALLGEAFRSPDTFASMFIWRALTRDTSPERTMSYGV
jgi:hypothetical protein